MYICGTQCCNGYCAKTTNTSDDKHHSIQSIKEPYSKPNRHARSLLKIYASGNLQLVITLLGEATPSLVPDQHGYRL